MCKSVAEGSAVSSKVLYSAHVQKAEALMVYAECCQIPIGPCQGQLSQIYGILDKVLSQSAVFTSSHTLMTLLPWLPDLHEGGAYHESLSCDLAKQPTVSWHCTVTCSFD